MNELVTNAFKYAFPNGRAGTIEVEVRSEGERIVAIVRDVGVGCLRESKSRLGTRLITLLTGQMKETLARALLAQGCEAQVTLAINT